MGLMGWIVALLAVLLLAAAGLLLTLRLRQKKEKTLVERVQTTDVFQALIPVLHAADRCCVERVLIRNDEVRVTLFKPMNVTHRFVFEERGFDRVDDPRILRALALAIPLHMERLNEEGGRPRAKAHYRFSAGQEKRVMGGSVVWYEYSVTPAYRDELTRAWYDASREEDVMK